MAVTTFTGGQKLDAAGDALSGGFIAKLILHVNTTGAAATAMLRQDGASGPVLFIGDTGASDTSVLYEGQGVPTQDLTVDTLDAGHIMVFGNIG